MIDSRRARDAIVRIEIASDADEGGLHYLAYNAAGALVGIATLGPYADLEAAAIRSCGERGIPVASEMEG